MATRLLYLDCFSGLAGDMTLGALIDLGLSPDALREALGSLPLPPWRLRTARTNKMGLSAVDVHVEVGGRIEGPAIEAPEHDHAHEHPPVHTHDHDHDHAHAHPHDHAHPHPHDHAHPHDHGPAFHYAEIHAVLAGGDLPAPVVARAQAAFDCIADAEARVHGVPREAVHFHEVGAVDSVVDLCGVAYGLWKLGIDRIESAPPPMGRGFVRCAHGRMPLPAPATLEILRGLPVAPCGLERELVTPTGAAFIKAWAARVGGFPAMVVDAVGYGAGDADFSDRPNVLRAVLGRLDDAAVDCVLVETNLDDLNPELAGFLLERLFDAGALDAWFVPIQMKKNRPALQVGCLVSAERAAVVEGVLLAESSAIGLRRFPTSRRVLARESVVVDTPFGLVAVKVAREGGRVLNVAPEYESAAAAARARQVPLKSVYQHAVAAYLGREQPE